MLQNRSPGVLLHLRGGVQKAVTGDLSVGVDDQDVVAESDVTCSEVSLMLSEDTSRQPAYHQPKYGPHLPQQYQ